jgi:hypothetical protein
MLKERVWLEIKKEIQSLVIDYLLTVGMGSVKNRFIAARQVVD